MAVYSKFYFKIEGEWVYQGNTYGTSWSVSSLDLQYSHAYQWRVDTYDTSTGKTTTGDTWSFTVEEIPTTTDSDDGRPDDYDPDLVYGYYDGEYQWFGNYECPDVFASGGGRYGRQLVAIGHNCIYFGSI
jgi:hypothetical protein